MNCEHPTFEHEREVGCHYQQTASFSGIHQLNQQHLCVQPQYGDLNSFCSIQSHETMSCESPNYNLTQAFQDEHDAPIQTLQHQFNLNTLSSRSLPQLNQRYDHNFYQSAHQRHCEGSNQSVLSEFPNSHQILITPPENNYDDLLFDQDQVFYQTQTAFYQDSNQHQAIVVNHESSPARIPRIQSTVQTAHLYGEQMCDHLIVPQSNSELSSSAMSSQQTNAHLMSRSESALEQSSNSLSDFVRDTQQSHPQLSNASDSSYMAQHDSGHQGNSVNASETRLYQRQQQQELVDMRSCGNISQDWLDTICRHLIEHMDRFGICVIDNFLGPLRGESILEEVLELYNSGQYTSGRLVNSNRLASRAIGDGSGIIRSDRVIWIDGCESGCSEINTLIQTLCSVITNSSRLSLYSNNGLDKIVINKRTKAHVACYPGNGTRYVKHVDNPNGDGRVITSIYYLNKDWNTKRDGGLLRMFPVGMDEVANIEPLFDRALFFWSDRRNPHEVLPAFRDRFAITVWYIGEDRP